MSSGETVVIIDRVVTDADMRRTRSLWERYAGSFAGLRKGHGVLLVSRDQRMVRLVDSHLNQWTTWARDGEVFDLSDIEERVNRQLLAISLRVRTGGKAGKRDRQLSLPKPAQRSQRAA